jgi:HAD superfamily hydrolase (TIGR01509 family)
VLTKTARLHAAAWKETFDAFLEERARAGGPTFVPFDEVRDYERYVDGRPRLDGVRAFLAARGLRLPEGGADDPSSEETVRGLAQRKNEVWLRFLHERGVVPYEGSTRYVNAVRAAGLATAVVSSSRHCHEVLDAAGLRGLFSAVIDGRTARAQQLRGKPAPDTYLAAARALGVPAPQAAVFEDALAGVQAGRSGSFGYVVGVDRLGQANDLRSHGADVVVPDLAALLSAP